MARESMRAFLWAAIVVGVGVFHSSVHAVDLTGDLWDVTGRDVNFTWDESDLMFTSQTPNGADFDLEGYFDWVGTNGGFAREVFVGTLSADLSLSLTGIRLEPHPTLGGPTGVGSTSYTAQVTADGNNITGLWDGTPVTEGSWEAVRLPEPTTAVMLGLAGGWAIAGSRRRRA